eukprot:SAG31_NODE_22828_length_517_cov_0.744019_1_plen_86_part_10
MRSSANPVWVSILNLGTGLLEYSRVHGRTGTYLLNLVARGPVRTKFSSRRTDDRQLAVTNRAEYHTVRTDEPGIAVWQVCYMFSAF